ncbi:TVP38/TMEM64 family protein [Streptomyces sp. 549]|uniref:TVP38/TMEM64 family protein n=1 Tax=Streptomyces sp. 549 TaxID=3049076 RepID=UPI0024C2D629|nr:TVP38/TMEM64 family protein [Streptomyces sp. 549]MDK1476639.1 TVP38/TMEM64 family protein [Streptomyces sp. 549]
MHRKERHARPAGQDGADASDPRARPAGANRSAAAPDRPALTRGTALRLALLLLLVAGLGYWAVKDGGETLSGLNTWVASLGLWAPLMYALVFAVAQAAFVPGSVLTASAGVLFGVALGSATVLVGATVGAALCFGLARWLGRPAVARLAGSGRLADLDERLSRRGFAAVLVLRLVPVFPFAAVNYGAAVTAVRFTPYLAATVVGTAPATVVYAGLGGSLTDPGSPALWWSMAGLLALTVGGWWLARRTAPGHPSPTAGPLPTPGPAAGPAARSAPATPTAPAAAPAPAPRSDHPDGPGAPGAS